MPLSDLQMKLGTSDEKSRDRVCLKVTLLFPNGENSCNVTAAILTSYEVFKPATILLERKLSYR
jgi:hypothetical protein